MKKIISIIISLTILTVPALINAETADNELIQDGVYIQFGRYNNEPILWRCVSTEDENGKLIVSDKILCYKAYDSARSVEKFGVNYKYGDGYWPDSNIRTWLNSGEFGGKIKWPGENPPSANVSYDQENGFLHSSNFSETELSVIKTVSQWLILSSDNVDKATNGYKNCFATNINYATRQYVEMPTKYTDISQLTHIEGAMCRVVDTVFLLDEIQIYSLWSKYDAYSEPTEKALKQYAGIWDTTTSFNYPMQYWLRSGGGGTAKYIKGSSGYYFQSAFLERGVRPAFYLNEDKVRIISGSGEWYDPYVIDGYVQEETAVFSQGEQLTGAQINNNANGEIMAPVRDVFESFGANVQYYDVDDGIITATNDERTVVIQIGNCEMGNGSEVFTLHTAPVIINNKAMISLEGIENAYNCKTEYVEELDRLIIDKPSPQNFGDGYGLENWQQARAILNGTYE